MKRYLQRIGFIGLLFILVFMGTINVSAAKTGWVKSGKSYQYKVNGETLKNTLKKIKGKYYYFDKKGNRKSGWVTINKSRYYFDKAKGYAYTGVKKVGNTMYLFAKNGKLVRKKGFYKANNKTYYVNKKGKIIFGWKKISGQYRHFDLQDGHMDVGEVKIGKDDYIFGSNGVPLSGIVSRKNGKSFCDKKGKIYVSQFITVQSKRYYADASGMLQKGIRIINGEKYYFGDDYIMKTGLIRLGGNIFYFDANGRMVKNKYVTVGNKQYYFDNTGCAKQNCWYDQKFFDRNGQVVSDAVKYDSSVKGQVSAEMLDKLHLENCSKLMIVAHPDDESFWGGAHLAEGGYFVLCLTNNYVPVRVSEFQSVMKASGNIGLVLGYPDLLNYEKFIRSDWSAESKQIVKDLNTVLTYKKWGLVVTHNPEGEYGHIHHKLTSKLVTQSFYRNYWTENLFYFEKYYTKDELEKNRAYIKMLPDSQKAKKESYLKLYKSQVNSLRLYSHMAQTEEWVRASDWK